VRRKIFVLAIGVFVGILLASLPLTGRSQGRIEIGEESMMQKDERGYEGRRRLPCVNPEESPEKVFREMGPAMGLMMKGMMSAMLDFLCEPESAEKLATFTRNYYDALIKKGFTQEQALRIVISQGIPSMGK
jgi:hypothetical protein